MAGRQQRRSRFVGDMFAAFGDRALDVARAQQAAATGAAAGEWSAIAAALHQRHIEATPDVGSVTGPA